MSSTPEAIDLFAADANTRSGQYGRDVRFGNVFYRLELVPELIGPAVEVFDIAEPVEAKRYEGTIADLITLIEDDEFAAKAVEFTRAEIKAGI